MAGADGVRVFHPSPEARLLGASRFEVIPVNGVEQKVSALPRGATVTVTCSQRHGIDRTLEVCDHLAVGRYRVVPHLAARMVSGRDHLERIVERLRAAGIAEAFVIGGDASPPVGSYRDAGDLLEALSSLPYSLARIGVGGCPEGHPLISQESLLEALRRKQRGAQYVTTQICFDATVLVRWIHSLREVGIDLPVIVGLPGAVDRRKLAEISLRTGVGASLRYLANTIASLGLSCAHVATTRRASLARSRPTLTIRNWASRACTCSRSTRSRRPRPGSGASR